MTLNAINTAFNSANESSVTTFGGQGAPPLSHSINQLVIFTVSCLSDIIRAMGKIFPS